MPEKTPTAPIRWPTPDLTQDPTRSAQALADALFSDPASPRTTQQQLTNTGKAAWSFPAKPGKAYIPDRMGA